MKKSTLLTGLFLFAATMLMAGNTKETNNTEETTQLISLKGKIVDKQTGEALTGALIKIEGTSLETYTDFDGNFSFDQMTDKVVDLHVSLVSYKENTLKGITLSSNNNAVLEIAIED